MLTLRGKVKYNDKTEKFMVGFSLDNNAHKQYTKGIWNL